MRSTLAVLLCGFTIVLAWSAVGDDRRSFPELKVKVNEMIPLGRAGTDMEVAHAVRFLASEEADYVTGHVLKVNGGNANGLDEVTIS